MVTDHIRALDEVDNADVNIVFPKQELFASEQNPVTASVIITPKPSSDITTNRKKIEGIQKLLKFAVAGLKDENIVITAQDGLVLNDFSGMEDVERIGLIERGQKMIRTLETQYRAQILKSLQSTFSADRVRDLNIKIDMDLSKKHINTEEYYGITLRPRTPGLSYDDSEVVSSVTRSQTTSTTTFEGMGINPEGPSGVEGQTPPAFRDMSNTQGKMNQETKTTNEELNKRIIEEDRTPTIDRVTVSVNIDGNWKLKYDEKNNPVTLPDGTLEREYVAMGPNDLRNAQALIRDAIGFNAARGDSVTVQNIPFDRTQEFAALDAARRQQGQYKFYALVILGGILLLLVGFMVFRAVSREMERRRRLAEEERSRREQALRESALMQAEEENAMVSMSVEDQTRMELHENIANMAKEHPEDVAQLLRTWLLEE
jgi:flagellar M-ring protein FliF